MKKTLLLAVVGILAVASFASAANLEGQFSVSPVIGGYAYDTDQPRKSDANMIYGARAGYNLTRNIGIEGLFDYVDSSFQGNDINMYRYGGEILYHIFPDKAFVPYLAAGFAGLNFDAKGIDRKVHGAFDYGVGAKLFLSDSFAIRVDIRHLLYNMDNRTNNNLGGTIGAYIPFGGSKPVSKPVEVPPAQAPTPSADPKVAEPAPVPQAVPTATLTATPATVTKGQSATLNWTSQYASGCSILPGIGPVPPEGVRVITPAASTSYTVDCSGPGGTARSAAVVTVVDSPPTPEKFCSKPAVLIILFDFDKSDIKPEYNADLKNLGAFLMEFPKAKGKISGHADSTASLEYNQKLSERRAERVGKYISSTFGIDYSRITTKGYGETKPIASNKTKEGRARNRRIEANFTCE